MRCSRHNAAQYLILTAVDLDSAVRLPQEPGRSVLFHQAVPAVQPRQKRRARGRQFGPSRALAGQAVCCVESHDARCGVPQRFVEASLLARSRRVLAVLFSSWAKYYLRSPGLDRKSTRLNSSHVAISYAVFCLKKKKYIYLG